MKMLSILTPHMQMESVTDLTLERLRQLDRCGLLLDVDCTLKDYGSPIISPPVLNWLASMRNGGIRMCLLSNGRAARIEPLAKSLQLPFVARAFKPLPFGCRAGLRLLDLPPEQTAMVGDQIFADVLAGRLARLLTVLVRPTTLIEPIWTRIKRPFERFVLNRISMHAPPGLAEQGTKIEDAGIDRLSRTTEHTRSLNSTTFQSNLPCRK